MTATEARVHFGELIRSLVLVAQYGATFPDRVGVIANSAAQGRYRLRRYSSGVFGTVHRPRWRPAVVHGQTVPAAHGLSVFEACQP